MCSQCILMICWCKPSYLTHWAWASGPCHVTWQANRSYSIYKLAKNVLFSKHKKSSALVSYYFSLEPTVSHCSWPLVYDVLHPRHFVVTSPSRIHLHLLRKYCSIIPTYDVCDVKTNFARELVGRRSRRIRRHTTLIRGRRLCLQSPVQ